MRRPTPAKGSPKGRVIIGKQIIEEEITPVTDMSFHALCSVLIVEDDFDIRRALSETLAYEGYQVIAAKDSREGLAIARVLNPAVIILDLLNSGSAEFTDSKKSDSSISGIPVISIEQRPIDVDSVINEIARLEERNGGHGDSK